MGEKQASWGEKKCLNKGLEGTGREGGPSISAGAGHFGSSINDHLVEVEKTAPPHTFPLFVFILSCKSS